MTVYAAMYCPCIYESAFMVVGIYFKKEDAERRIHRHKAHEYKDFRRIYPTQEDEVMSFEELYGWKVEKMTIK